MITEIIKLKEEIIILLLGIRSRSIPSKFHLQKELFILSRSVPKLQDILIFDKHYHGAYSVEVQDLVRDNLFYYKNAIEERNGRIYLTEKGRQDYEKIYEKYRDDDKFLKLLKIMKMIREIYDKLSKEELALLRQHYAAEESPLIDACSNREKEIVERLRVKGYITEERYKELLREYLKIK